MTIHKKYMVGAVALSLISGGSTAPAVQKIEKPKQNIENYQYKDTSKAVIKINDKEIDITEYVVNYKDGNVFVSPEAFDAAFGMKESEITEEEKREYLKNEKENNIIINEEAPFLKYQNEKYTLIMRAGSKLYSINNHYSFFDNAIIKNEEGKYSCSLVNIILGMDNDSMGTSIVDDKIIYTIF